MWRNVGTAVKDAVKMVKVHMKTRRRNSMMLAKALKIGKEESYESKKVVLMSVRATKNSYFNSIDGLLEVLSNVTVGMPIGMYNGFNVTVENKKITTGRQDMGLYSKYIL